MKFILALLSIIGIANSAYFLIPDPNDCSVYKIFYEGNVETTSCLAGLHFSPTQLTCMSPAQARCERNYWCRGDAPLYVPDPANCKAYHECSNGSPIRKVCGPGLWWDYKDNICTDKSSVKCDSRSIINPSNPGQYRSELMLNSRNQYLTPKTEVCNRKKDLFSNGEYLKSICIITAGLTYEDAHKRCAANDMNLFIIDDEEVKLQFYDGIMTLINDAPYGIVWINGKRQTFSKNWEVFNADGSVLGPLYSGVDFYSQYALGNCLQYSGQYMGQYEALPAPCNEGRWAICEHNLRTENPVQLDTSVCFYKKDLKYKDKYIKSMCVINSAMNYDNSRRKCASHGMNLFIFDTSETEEAFYEANEDIFVKHAAGHFWINGMRDCATNNWHVYHSNQSVSGLLYDGMEWVKKNNICGRTNGNCLKLSGQYGPYQALGASCAEGAWMICEYYN